MSDNEIVCIKKRRTVHKTQDIKSCASTRQLEIVDMIVKKSSKTYTFIGDGMIPLIAIKELGSDKYMIVLETDTLVRSFKVNYINKYNIIGAVYITSNTETYMNDISDEDQDEIIDICEDNDYVIITSATSFGKVLKALELTKSHLRMTFFNDVKAVKNVYLGTIYTLHINQHVMNKGICAGGKNTTYQGKRFEESTNNELKLLEQGYIKFKIPSLKKYYLSKQFDDKKVIFISQSMFKGYMKDKYGINVFRCPDEAYILEYSDGKKVLKILEKKVQNVEGSVETKIWSGPSLKREYELVLGSYFKVCYGFCINNFLEDKLKSNEPKYKILNIILKENDIDCMYGDNSNYFEMINLWIYKN